MKKLLFLAIVAAASYAGWQRYQKAQDTAPSVQWAAEQVGAEFSGAYVVFDAGPVDGRIFEVDGPGGASVMVMTDRMGYHYWKSNPELVINCRKIGLQNAQEMVRALNGMMLVSETRQGRRELDAMVQRFQDRAKNGGKRPCLRLTGNELKDPRIQMGGPIPARLVRVTQFEAMDCGDMIAGM